ASPGPAAGPPGMAVVVPPFGGGADARSAVDARPSVGGVGSAGRPDADALGRSGARAEARAATGGGRGREGGVLVARDRGPADIAGLGAGGGGGGATALVGDAATSPAAI